MTLTALARLAHVSISTASKAFSMSDEVNDETRRMIFRIAKEHHCFRTFFKAKYPKLTVGLICTELKSRYYAMFLELLEQELNQRNCEMIVTNSHFSTERIQEIMTYYEEYTSVDAIILMDEHPVPALHHEVPVIHIGRENPPRTTDSVCLHVDYRPGLLDAVSGFFAGGLTDIGFIGELLTQSKERILRDILSSPPYAGHLREEWFVIRPERFERGGYLCMEQLLSLPRIPQAVICGYDYMAYGAIRACVDHGLTVPGDIQIVGMDNLPESAYHIPRLSSVDMQSATMAHQTGELLTELITTGHARNPEICLPTKFIARDSTTVPVQSTDHPPVFPSEE